MAIAIADTLEFLLGSWSIERLIHDDLDGGDVRFTGVARVEPVPGGATYVEAGHVTRGAHRGPARRGLQLAAGSDGTVRLDFEDGRPFVELDLGSGSHSATHPCRSDSYEMDFEVLDANRIRERWRVSGPAKGYRAETIWRRL